MKEGSAGGADVGGDWGERKCGRMGISAWLGGLDVDRVVDRQ